MPCSTTNTVSAAPRVWKGSRVCSIVHGRDEYSVRSRSTIANSCSMLSFSATYTRSSVVSWRLSSNQKIMGRPTMLTSGFGNR